MTPPSEPTADLATELRRHLALCQAILAWVEQDHLALTGTASPAPAEARKDLLPRLNQSLDQIRKHRAYWQRLGPAERNQHKEVGRLLRQNQELIMKIVVLDRENEQALLRQGRVPPRHLPSVNRQRPHFVADLYRRNGVG